MLKLTATALPHCPRVGPHVHAANRPKIWHELRENCSFLLAVYAVQVN